MLNWRSSFWHRISCDTRVHQWFDVYGPTMWEAFSLAECNADAWREWEVADVQRELDDEHERQKREVSQTGSVNP